MEFLIELMSRCCCCVNPRVYSGKETRELLGSSQLPPPESRGFRGRKRRRGFPVARIAGGTGRGIGGSAAAEWRPSLTSISEEHVLPVRNEHVEAKVKLRSSKPSASERNLRRKLESTSRPPRFSFDDIHGGNSHMTMPTFSPAPFMF